MTGENPVAKSLPFIFAAVFFTGLGCLGFPRPMMDDLFFTGAGLNLAAGGDFSNPLLARQDFPGTLYFLHPPLHSYAIAGWLKIFGVSTASLLAFQAVMYVLICWSTICILRKHRAPHLLEWLLPLGVASAFLSVGLRSEPLAAALTMLGFALVECLGQKTVLLFCGFLLLFLGASVASRLSFFSAALALASFVRLFLGGTSFIRLGVLAGTALIVAMLGFSCLIGFHFQEFYKIYHFHAAGRLGGDIGSLLGHFFRGILGISQWPLLLLWLVSLPLLYRLSSKTRDLVRASLFVSGVFLLLMLTGIGGEGAIWYVVFSLFALTAAYAQQSSPGRSRLAQMSLAAALLIGNGRSGVELFGLATGHITTETNLQTIPAPASGRPVLINPESARYAFDYRLPKGAIDWNFSAPFPAELATETVLHPDDVYIVGPTVLEVLDREKWLDESVPRWNPLGRARWSFLQHPHWTYVINGKDCLPPKPQN
ncbi:MAG TPA: hypothetical protein VK815_06600 [Candidatus Acidoferrales bacterium]|nr:hypothetical protein [Candidatus Acidoferrales bacterium]